MTHIETLRGLISARRDICEAEWHVAHAAKHDRDLTHLEQIVVLNALRNARHHLATAELVTSRPPDNA